MKVLFSAYCMSDRGNSLIGVYKRSLRIAMELWRRGHQIAVFCPGREHYQDDVTAAAMARFEFVDFPLRALFARQPAKRRYYRRIFGDLRPDLIVCGEAPLAGTLLDSAVSAVAVDVPVVLLDNAYSPDLVRLFVDAHGPMADGIILTGPSSFHMADPPPWLCQVPPYIDRSPAAARALIAALGLSGRRLIVVLGYERKAEALAAALLPALDDLACEVVVVSPAPGESQERLAVLPAAIAARVRVVAPPPDPVLFGLIELACLAVGKCGFMQVSECLALRTPFVGVTYRGCFPVGLLPPAAGRFVHASPGPDPLPDVIAAARAFITADPDLLGRLHEGPLDAVARAADFLEGVTRRPRADTTAACTGQGYPIPLLEAALDARFGRGGVTVRRARCTRLRHSATSRIDAIACEFMVRERQSFAVLWGRRYDSAEAAAADLAAATAPGSSRRVLYASTEERLLIERDVGEAELPPLE